MEGMMTAKEAAELWRISDRRVAILCKEGRIPGAVRDKKGWSIPADADKPGDQRYKDAQNNTVKQVKKLPLPIGISDFKEAVSKYYYIDKTLLIRDFLDEIPKVSLFTRPRRFGKTLNMDMLRVFFEKTDKDTSKYFKNKKIWNCGEEYRRYQGKYPVIFITFKDVKRDTWEETYDHISKLLREEFERHSELLDSGRCSEYEKIYYKRILNGEADSTDIMSALQNLSKMLDEHYGVAPIIIIDEYDTPIQQGYMRDYYDKIILFMRNLFSGGLKDNKHLSYGFLTGILRVAKESIFSGLNNLATNSILDSKYSQYFGFTPDEVREIAEYYGVTDKYDEICEWYDGYYFGSHEIFNPWSVINYFRNDCQTGAYWQATGSNDIIGDILANADEDIYEHLKSLLQGMSFLTQIDTGVIYPQMQNNPSSIYSFLLVAGYLKVIKSDGRFAGNDICEVAIPNKEISYVYNKEILEKMQRFIMPSTAAAIQTAIYTYDSVQLQKQLEKLLLQTVSYHDTANEDFYHGFVLGLCAMLDNRYDITSNRESGKGRYDIQMKPYDVKLPGVIIEIKAESDCGSEKLRNVAKAALGQINEKKYEADMIKSGVNSILKYGVAFCGKEVEVISE